MITGEILLGIRDKKNSNGSSFRDNSFALLGIRLNAPRFRGIRDNCTSLTGPLLAPLSFLSFAFTSLVFIALFLYGGFSKAKMVKQFYGFTD